MIMNKYEKTLDVLEDLLGHINPIPGVNVEEIINNYKDLLALHNHIKPRCKFYGVERVKIEDSDFSGLWPNKDYPSFYNILAKVCEYNE